jgi:ApbE superfamily uncharacterized protein (UPF0280 family)
MPGEDASESSRHLEWVRPEIDPIGQFGMDAATGSHPVRQADGQLGLKDLKKNTDRSYRRRVRGRFTPVRVTVQETDLSVYAQGVSVDDIKDAVIVQRGYVENYIRCFPAFAQTLEPWPEDLLAPPIVQGMIRAGKLAGVGPMAAVAGAVAERVGVDLLRRTDEIIIENGGDIFIRTAHPLTVGVFAGRSPLSMKIGIAIEPSEKPQAICTSSGSVGHSLSRGLADAVCVVGSDCSVADAAATAIGNRVSSDRDVQPAIQWGSTIEGVEGILVIIASKIGMWGRIRVKPL